MKSSEKVSGHLQTAVVGLETVVNPLSKFLVYIGAFLALIMIYFDSFVRLCSIIRDFKLALKLILNIRV